MSTMIFMYAAVRVTVDGLEEFLILPTAWYYIDLFGETKLFLGVTLAAYSIGMLITSPFIGALDDRFRVTKAILVFSAVFKFLGHLTYSIPVNAYFPLFGRLISGFGGGSIGVLYAMVSRYTDIKSRAKSFLLLGGLFNLGTTLAPSIGSFLTFNLDILGWNIGPGNSPGFLLTIIWFFMIVATVVCVPQNVGREKSFSLEEIQPDVKSDDENDPESKTDNPPIFNCKIVCLYFVIFMAFFFYCVTGFYVPLLAADRFHLQLIHIKVLFVNGTLIAVVAYLINYLALEYVSERNLVVAWISFQIFPIFLLFYFALAWNNSYQVIGPYLLLPLICLGLPCFSYSIVLSLLSKITDFNHAALSLSLASTVVHVSIISSRLIAGLTFSATSMTVTCIGLSFLWVVQVVWYYVEYRKLVAIRV